MSEKRIGAVAIFVKTPGLSPIKTRLASTVGGSAAEHFHLLSAKAGASAVQIVSLEVGALTPYWAVAEKEGLTSEHWQSFQTIWQGEGDLGSRLAQVYDELIQQHSFVIFMGADSPHITKGLIMQAATILSNAISATFVLGRAKDGGFYLFGGNSTIPHDIWLDVPYSVATTASELASKISSIGPIIELQTMVDVDCAADFAVLLQDNIDFADLTLEQRDVILWVREMV